MKEVTSAVWLQGLDVSYLREQVGEPSSALQIEMHALYYQ